MKTLLLAVLLTTVCVCLAFLMPVHTDADRLHFAYLACWDVFCISWTAAIALDILDYPEPFKAE